MRVLKKTRRIMDRLLEALVIVVMATLVIDVSWQVFTRFVLKSPSTWTDELATFLLIWVSLLGAAVALKRGAHLGVDYFVERMTPRNRRRAAIFACLCTAAFSLLAMTVGGAVLVARKLGLQETSPALGLNLGYVYLALPISGLFLTIYSIELLVNSARTATPKAAGAAEEQE
ncbi:MAG: TRAP transporter small permease [Planctomycetes bacterium]|nr:TRAP transporter small permease [Planctomycetota bacterium]